MQEEPCCREANRMWRIMRIALMLSTAAMAVPAGAQELLKGASFEEFGAEGVPVGWTRYGGNSAEAVLEPSEDAHGGQRALRMLDTGPEERDNRWAAGVSQDVAVTPGATYMLSVWAKAVARNRDEAVILQLTFLPGNQLQNVHISPEIGGDWSSARRRRRVPHPRGCTSTRCTTGHQIRSLTTHRCR